MIVTTKELFEQAYGKYAVGAYNINNLEQTVGLFRGCVGKTSSNDEPSNPAKSAPFIIQISRGARAFTDKRFLEAMIRTAEDVYPEAIFAVHLDHGDRALHVGLAGLQPVRPLQLVALDQRCPLAVRFGVGPRVEHDHDPPGLRVLEADLDHLDVTGIAQHVATREVETSGTLSKMGVDVGKVTSQVKSQRHLRQLGASTPNAKAQQPGRSADRNYSKDRTAAPVCCSGWGGPERRTGRAADHPPTRALTSTRPNDNAQWTPAI